MIHIISHAVSTTGTVSTQVHSYSNQVKGDCSDGQFSTLKMLPILFLERSNERKNEEMVKQKKKTIQYNFD